MSGEFALGRRIPSAEGHDDAVGLGPSLVQVPHEPEAQEPGERALQVQRSSGDGAATRR